MTTPSLPHDRGTEEALIGALLLDRDAIATVQHIVHAGDFYIPACATVFQTVLDLFRRREPADLVTVTSALEQRGLLDSIGGPAWLSGLLTTVPAAVHAPFYAQQIADLAIRRRLIHAGSEIVRLAYSTDGTDAETALSDARVLLNGLSGRARRDRGLPIADAMASLASEIDARWDGSWIDDAMPTGLYDLDKRLSSGGFERGQAVFVGARPGAGKTAFALQLALNAARRARVLSMEPEWTIFFSSEMTTAALCWRALAESTGIPVPQLKRGIGLSPEQKRHIGDQLEELMNLPIWIDDTSSPTIAQMHDRIERLATTRPVRMAFFDYLEQAGDERGRQESEEVRVSRIAAGLKRIAKTCNITMVALSQLNRETEKRKTDRYVPVLADLRQSGRIEQEADIVILLYREDYYVRMGMLESTPGKEGTADIYIAKQRDGESGVVTVSFVPELTAFRNLDRR